jgi:hypothetical protein
MILVNASTGAIVCNASTGAIVLTSNTSGCSCCSNQSTPVVICTNQSAGCTLTTASTVSITFLGTSNSGIFSLTYTGTLPFIQNNDTGGAFCINQNCTFYSPTGGGGSYASSYGNYSGKACILVVSTPSGGCVSASRSVSFGFTEPDGGGGFTTNGCFVGMGSTGPYSGTITGTCYLFGYSGPGTLTYAITP